MASERELAVVEDARAYQVGEYLLVRVIGEKPDGCHVVEVERSLLDVEPPAFLATWRRLLNARCIPESQPYEHQQAFQVGVRRDTITVHHAGGELSVAVEDLGPGAEAPVRALSGAHQVLGPGGLPQGGEAIGTSRNFDFDEAFGDAIAKIPTPDIPDWLATYTVLEVGAQIGGIAGFNHLFVRVRGG
ncbi:MAG TPA: hypothetical protein VK975_05310 [Acidimicrobiales bacterium]|nr:hypothetical protein [Acidimicrobiales bacterium]